MRGATTLTALPLVLVAGLLAGCSGGDDGTLEYVALGDSYTAAPGAGQPDGVDGCFRVQDNYPHLVAEELDLELTDVSCSGAATTNVTGPQNVEPTPRPPQLDAVSDSTDIVTLSLGANDFSIIGRFGAVCFDLGPKDPTGQPCTDLDAEAGDGDAEHTLDAMQANLVDTIEEVQDKAPDARIIVVGYPQMFPDPADGGCAVLPLADGDLPYARRLNIGLNTALQEAAEETGVEYLDTFTGSAGHDICGDEPWVAGSEPVDGVTAAAYHPTLDEQAFVAGLLIKMLD